MEIARALALDPVLLAMDEPAAGLNPSEVDGLDDLITRIRARGTAVLLVEHHMDLVMGISDEISVLYHREMLAEGDASGDPGPSRGDRPMLADPQGFATFIGTPEGPNEFWRLYENAKKDPSWFRLD